MIQHDRVRRILDFDASQQLFSLLSEGGKQFRTRLLAGAIRNLGRYNEGARGELYLNVGHTGLDSLGFRDWVRRSDLRPVYLVHDLIPVTHPQFCRTGEADRHGERMRTVLSTGAGVIGNSRATLHELASFARSEGYLMPNSVAAWLGTEEILAPTPRESVMPPTFVILGTIEARKNHILLLKIWSRLVDRLGSGAPRLLIIGQRGWEAEQVFRVLDRDDSLQGRVRELNNCSDEELALHLASARALLFPSFTEGYGLPLIEALAASVPVIASDLPAFRELCRNIPTYLDADDEAGWEKAILDYARPESISRKQQIQRMKTFEPPSWADHFAKVEAWLRTVS